MTESPNTTTPADTQSDAPADDRIAERFVLIFGVIGLLCSLIAVVMIFDHLGDLRGQQRPDHSTSTHDGGRS